MSSPASRPTPLPPPAEVRLGDALSVAFADEPAGVYGFARVELDERGGQARSLVAVFAGGRPLALTAGQAPLAPGGLGRDPIDGGGLLLHDDDGVWSARFAGAPDGIGAFSLDCEPVLPWLGVPASDEERQLQRVSVHGELQLPSGPLAVEGTGQLTLSRQAAPGAAAVTRDLAVWVADRLTLDLSATRERAGDGIDTERLQAVVIGHDPPSVQAIEEPRLSTTYDAEGRPLRVGMELWLTAESAHARRVAGDVLCAATLTSAAGRWDCAFLRWRTDSGPGIGPYAIWRSAPGRS